ncbi:MAG: hypothetical protein NZT92_07370 [Abditibacteriales bacterium]|nr:hypothetical protein [Abditibacteriales bacterium]MDW8364675.1 hypothetical protein [Abditibacteriales bacterium]
MRSRSLHAAACLALLLATPVHAHEPLWGEAASTVGTGIFHPDVKFEVRRNFRLLHGRDPANNPTDLHLSRSTQRIALDYGMGPKMNLRLDVPIERLRMSETVAGVLVSSRYTEVGDVEMSVKRRIALRVGAGTKSQQAMSFGLRLPTGSTSKRNSHGDLIPPDMQPGTGTFGVRLGYMTTRETRKNTVWFSAFWEEPLRRRRFTPSREVEFDASYGHWLKFPESLPDLGTMLSLGVRGHWFSKHRLPTGLDPNSGGAMLASHITFVAQKDQYQLRLGLLVPLRQRVNGTQPAERMELRVGLEGFF